MGDEVFATQNNSKYSKNSEKKGKQMWSKESEWKINVGL